MALAWPTRLHRLATSGADRPLLHGPLAQIGRSTRQRDVLEHAGRELRQPLIHSGFRTLNLDGEEERLWCTKGASTDVLGLLRLWAYHVVGLLKGRYLRAPWYRALTVAGFVEWLERVSVWGEAGRRVRRVVPAR